MKLTDQIKLILQSNPDVKSWSDLKPLLPEGTDHRNANNQYNKIITKFFNTSNSREKNDILPFLHSLPSLIWSYCVDVYGPEWGRLMSYILSCHREDIIVPQEVLGSCHVHGYSSLLIGRKPNYKDLSADIYDRHVDECPFNLNLSDYIPEKSARTVMNYEISEELKELIINCKDTNYVDVFTGKPTNPFNEDSTPSSVPNIETLRLRLNSQDLDYKTLVGNATHIVYNTLNSIDNIRERVKQLSILNKVIQSPQPVYSAVDNSTRLYTKGASFQSMTRQTRNAFFTNKRQFDLKHAQLIIVSQLWGAQGILEYFKGQSVWATLVAETGLNKDTIKKGVYTLIFGGTYVNAVKNMADVAEMPYYKVLDKIAACKFFKILETASKNYSDKIKKEGTCIDAFGKELVPQDKKLTNELIRSIKGCQAQSYEIAVMTPILNHLLDKGFNCWLFMHDGFISDSNSYMIYPELKALCEFVGKQYNMNFTLEMETLD